MYGTQENAYGLCPPLPPVLVRVITVLNANSKFTGGAEPPFNRALCFVLMHESGFLQVAYCSG